MANVVCPKGHHYNPDDNPTCPYCEREAAGQGDYDWSEVDVSGTTEYMSRSRGYIGSTEVIGNRGFGGSGGTEVLGNRGFGSSGGTEVLGNRGFGSSGGGTEVTDGNTRGPWGKQPDPNMTTPAWDKKEYQHQPVVGWLVCIEGPDKGKDFSLHGAKSSIGRKKDSSICLEDPKISRDGYPALIVYDDRKSHKFYLASGDANSRNNVELDGNMLLGQSVINPYDEIRIEDTVLVFVPFCGEDFYWEDKNDEQMR